VQFLSDYWPRIGPDDTFGLWAVILASVALSIHLERRYAWAAKLSGPVIALMLAMVLSNLQLMPKQAPTYEITDKYLVPLAIPLLLMRANVFRVVRKTGPLFLAFHISSVGTVLGALAAGFLYAGTTLKQVPEIAGIMTGSYIGGAINFFAVKAAYGVDADLTNPLLVADNFIMAGLFVVLLLIAGSRFFLARYPHPLSVGMDAAQARAKAARYWRPKRISLLDVARALAVAAVIAAIANGLAQWIQPAGTATATGKIDALALARSVLGNVYVMTPFVAVAAATIFRRTLTRIRGAQVIGTYLLFVFLFVIGLPADLGEVLLKVPKMFGFCLVIAGVNLVFTLVVGRLLRLNLEDLLLAVNANVGGPPTAAAMAVSKGWSRAVLPAILVGIWGYVIGTVVGVAVTEVLRRLL